eukprot:gene32261-41810_t
MRDQISAKSATKSALKRDQISAAKHLRATKSALKRDQISAKTF